MNYTYNVLWLDDEPIKALEQIREMYPSIYFEKVNYVDLCKNKVVEHPERYHAVILDANGVCSDSPEKDANKSGFLSLVHSVIEKHIPLYIYSGQLLRASDGDSADIVLEELYRLGLKEHIFYKSGGPYDLINKIDKDLNNKYQYYAGHEYVLEFFSSGWIPNEYKSEFMDPIMKCYCEKDYNSAHGNQMRNIIEKMLYRINEEYNFEPNSKKDDPNYYAKIAKAIKYRKLDYSQAICGPLLHMIDVANAKSHNAMPEEDRKLYFESDFSTFFIVSKWFYKMMTSQDNEQDATTNDDSNTSKPNKIAKAKTNENNRTGVIVSTYKENGKTYCDLKVEIPEKWKNYKELMITGVTPNSYPEKGKWYAYCQEVNNKE